MPASNYQEGLKADRSWNIRKHSTLFPPEIVGSIRRIAVPGGGWKDRVVRGNIEKGWKGES